MERIALPVFHARMSPVLDTCTRVLIVDLDEGRVLNQEVATLGSLSLAERAETLRGWRVHHVICAGVSDLMVKFLEGKRIRLTSGIAGNMEEILAAYRENRLDDPVFAMPGREGKALRR